MITLLVILILFVIAMVLHIHYEPDIYVTSNGDVVLFYNTYIKIKAEKQKRKFRSFKILFNITA